VRSARWPARYDDIVAVQIEPCAGVECVWTGAQDSSRGVNDLCAVAAHALPAIHHIAGIGRIGASQKRRRRIRYTDRGIQTRVRRDQRTVDPCGHAVKVATAGRVKSSGANAK
jgi:hypothetical protein